MRRTQSVQTAAPVLGTVLELRVGVGTAGVSAHEPADADADASSIAAHALAVVLAEIDRLEPLLSVHDPDSDLCRWRAGRSRDEDLHPEVAALLVVAAGWFVAGHGAFNPCTGELTSQWRRAADDGRVPASHDLARTVEAIANLPYEVVDGAVRRTGDCGGLDLNALAKGYVVDRALEVAMTSDERITDAVVNLGGDLRHGGGGEVRVGIEDPHAPYDNAAPLVTITLAGAALATSGGARRGFLVADRWYGHVLDPRTGQPADAVASVSVIAPDAMTADVIATVVGVLGPVAGPAFADRRPGVAALVVDAHGALHRSRDWARHERFSGA